MKKSILITGSTGFIGQRITPYLNHKYNITAPTRQELDLLNSSAVKEFIKKNKFDAVIHLANPTGQSAVDLQSDLFERSLKVFASLEYCSDFYEKMIYIGSGAEYGKHRSIACITEDQFGKEIPQDNYGFARYLINKLADKHENIINLRLFACHGPGDPPYKLIPHIIKCIKNKNPINLRQDAWFDYLYADDIFPVIEYFIENKPKYKAYNLCSGERILISSIAGEVKKQMNSDLPITFEKSELGLEYTGSNKRLKEEMPRFTPCSMKDGISKILEHER